MTCERIGYRAPAGEHSGIKTLVTDTSKKNLPSNTSKSPEQNYHDRPNVPEHREQALPITPKHEPRRDQKYLQTEVGQPSFNGPAESGKGPDEKTVHKDKVRTKSQPGEEYGHPYMDQGPAGIKKRRTDGPTASMKGPPYPGSHRQKKRQGPLKRYTQRYYKKNKNRIKMRMRRWYNVHARNKRYRLDKKRRRQHPERFRRLPGGGARTFAEQAKRRKKGSPAFWFYHPASDREGVLLRVTDEGVVLYAFDGVHGVTLLDAFLDQVVFDEADMDRAWEYLDDVFDCSDPDGDDDCDWESDMESIERVAARHDCQVRADFMYEKAETDRENTDSAYDRGQGWTKRKQKQEEESPILEHPYSHSVPNNPGSAKVIPEGHDFRNKDNRVLTRAASLARRFIQAAYISEIESRTAQEIHQKARALAPKLRRVDAKLGMWTWEVPGSGDKPYTVKVKATRKGNVLDMGKLDVYVACSCPFWQWQGPEFYAKRGKYLLGKPRGTASYPKEKDEHGNHAACKHVLSVFAKLKAMGSVRKEWGQRQGSLDLRYLADRIAQGDVRLLSVQRVASRYREKYLLDSEG